MSYLKHDEGKPSQKKRESKKPAAQSSSEGMSLLDHHELPRLVDSMAYGGLSEIAEQLDKIFRQLGAYCHEAAIGEHSLNLFTGTNSYPVKLSLEGEEIESIADSLKRIADAMSLKSLPPCGETNAKECDGGGG
jgi:hypothetical protein